MAVAEERRHESSTAIYLPQINRTLFEQLDAHLRSFFAPMSEGAVAPVYADMGPYEDVAADTAARLRSDQLESTLRRVQEAARIMAACVSEKTDMVDEGLRLRDTLARLEDKLSTLDRDFHTLSAALHEARRDAEEHRYRAEVAEDKLESLTEAVGEMIAQFGPRDTPRSQQTSTVDRRASQSDEVSL